MVELWSLFLTRRNTMAKRIPHTFLAECLKASRIEDKQLSFIKKAKSGEVFIDDAKLMKKIKAKFPEAKWDSIRQRIYNINNKLKEAKSPTRFKIKPKERKPRAKVDYAALYSMD